MFGTLGGEGSAPINILRLAEGFRDGDAAIHDRVQQAVMRGNAYRITPEPNDVSGGNNNALDFAIVLYEGDILPD